MNTSALEKVPQELSSVHLVTGQSLQQPTILDITPSYSNIPQTIDCTTATDVLYPTIEVWVSDSQVLAHSCTVCGSHVRTPFEGGTRTAVASVHGTDSQKSTGSYVGGTELFSRTDVWKTSSVVWLKQSSDRTLYNRALLATVHSIVYSTVSKADSSLYRDNFITSRTDFHPTQSIEHEKKSYLPDSEQLHSIYKLINKTTITGVFPFTLESHYMRSPYENAGSSIPYSLKTRHQTLSLVTASSLAGTVVNIRPATSSSESIRISTILERKQTQQEALSDTGGLSKVWRSYQHYLLTAAGCLVVAILLAFVAARYKRYALMKSVS